MHKSAFSAEGTPGPAVGGYSACSTPLDGSRGLLLRGGEREPNSMGMEGKGEEDGKGKNCPSSENMLRDVLC